MKLLGDVGNVESCFGLLRDRVVQVQVRFMVCAKRSIVSEIILDALDDTPR